MNIFCRNDVNGILDTRLDILNGQVGIVILNDFGKRKPFSDYSKTLCTGIRVPATQGLPK
jgi:hypothetical protein